MRHFDQAGALGKALGVVGLGIDVLQIASELIEVGTVKNSTGVYTAIDAILLAVAFTPAAPVAAVAGVIWGAVKLIWGKKITESLDSDQPYFNRRM